jgi:replicative DNA helicase
LHECSAVNGEEVVEMSCWDREQADNRVKNIQSSTLSSIGVMVERATFLEEAASMVHADDAGAVRAAAARLRDMIAIGREVESYLDEVNTARRAREEAARSGRDMEVPA